MALIPKNIKIFLLILYEIFSTVLRYNKRKYESILYVFFVYSPRYVFWYHNARMINFDSERGISVTTTPGRRTHSQLSIKKAEVVDSGNYTCAPSNSLPASIQVFVSGKIEFDKYSETW